MNLNRVNIVLGILLAITAAFAIAMDVDHTQPNVEFLPEMKRSPAYDAFSTNSVLPHNRTLQAPVPGTIPRGGLPLYYAATKEDAIRAGEELQNPFALHDTTPPTTNSDDNAPNTRSDQRERLGGATSDVNQPATPSPAGAPGSVQRGAKVYGIFCVSCHGATGAGDGPVAKRGFPPPPPLTTGKSAKMKDGQLFHILTYGQGSMSSMAAQLDRNRRWDVINYVRSMQEGAVQAASATATGSLNQSAGPESNKSTDPNADPSKAVSEADEGKP